MWAEPTPLEFHEVGTLESHVMTVAGHSFPCLPAQPPLAIEPLLSIALCLQVGSPEAADLQVDFLHGFHGDGYPFDGAGGAVGHAFFPSDPARAGGVHLDAEEEWAFRQPGGTMFRNWNWVGWVGVKTGFPSSPN